VSAASQVRRVLGRVKRRIRPVTPWWEVADGPWTRLELPRAAVRCLVCGWSGAAFEGPVHCEGNRCPRCGSIGRDRFLHLCLHERIAHRPGLRLLETIPRMDEGYRNAMARWFTYTSSDYDERAHRGAMKLDLQAIDLPDASLDVVLTAHVLEHVPDTDRALAELHRVVAPGGWVFLQVPVLQAATAPPSEPEFHGDDTPVFWRFGFDLTERLRAQGFVVELLCPDELLTLARSGATSWPGTSSPEFDADAIVAAAPLDDLVGVADARAAHAHGCEPAYMYLTWACHRVSG
jgi:SAM-dependent methyltransferase